MPYNSSAFEKQLAKHKAEQAAKAIADLPDAGHRGALRATPGKGAGKQGVEPRSTPVRSQSLQQIIKDGPERKPLHRTDQMLDARDGKVVVVGRRKPLYRRTWFVMLVFSVVSTALSPVIFKDEIAHIRGLMEGIKTSTGIDPLSIDTYKDMAKGRLASPTMTGITGNTALQPVVAVPAPTTNTGQVVEQAQERVQGVIRQGPDTSMRYIEEEAKRLEAMARELDGKRRPAAADPVPDTQ